MEIPRLGMAGGAEGMFGRVYAACSEELAHRNLQTGRARHAECAAADANKQLLQQHVGQQGPSLAGPPPFTASQITHLS
eukprot:107159-Prorocentrum_lima.AAC.1